MSVTTWPGEAPLEPAPIHPAAAHLTERQRLYAEAYAYNGDGNRSRAAVEAGCNETYAAQEGYRLSRSAGVQQYIAVLTAEAIGSLAPIAVQTQRNLLLNARSDFVKAQVAQDVLDRLGMRTPEKHLVSVEGQVSVKIDLG